MPGAKPSLLANPLLRHLGDAGRPATAPAVATAPFDPKAAPSSLGGASARRHGCGDGGGGGGEAGPWANAPVEQPQGGRLQAGRKGGGGGWGWAEWD